MNSWLAKLHNIERADSQAIQHFSQIILQQLLLQWMGSKATKNCAVIRCGDMHELEILLLRYELQDMDVQSIDLGSLDPLQLGLVSDRLKVDFILIYLGTGLKASWFEQQKNHWPEKTFFTGEIGKAYQQSGWLSKPFIYPIKTLAHHETFTGLV